MNAKAIRSASSFAMLLLLAITVASVNARSAHAESSICEAYRKNYAREQAATDRMRNEPYKSNRQDALDEKRARLEQSCGNDDAFVAKDDAPIAREIATATPPSGSAPGGTQLEGGVDRTTLRGGVERSGTIPGKRPVLKADTPQLDPRGVVPRGQGSDVSRSTSDVSGKLLPRPRPATPGNSSSNAGPPGMGRAASGSRTTTSVTGKIIGRGGSATPSDDEIRATAHRLTGETAAAPAQGRAVDNAFTRSYFFSQGVLYGLLDGASEASGAMARTQVALYYLATARFVDAERVLGYTGSHSILRDMQQDLQDWKAAATTTTDPYTAYDNGRTAGRLLGKAFVQRFADRVGHAGDLPAPPDVTVSLPKSQP